MSNDRGVAHVLGVILLAGFTITVAATVAVAGAAMFSDSQSQIESSQVESAFSSLAADASELEDGESVEFDLGTADGQLEVKENTGNLRIYHDSDGIRPVYGTYDEEIDLDELERDDIEPISVNSLVYTAESGDTVAYQAGGVFQQRGSGSSLVSAPDFYYRDNALSFPIQKVDGDISSSGTLSGELELQREDRHYPVHDNDDKSNPLSGGAVYVEMESEYCQAWENYFDTQTRGSISEGCGEDHNTGSNDTVQVELSVPFTLDEGTFTHAIRAEQVDEGGGGNLTEGEDYDEGNYDGPSTGTLLDTMESDCSEEGYGDLDETVEEGGLYCIDGDLDSHHKFFANETSEDIEIYIDGDLRPSDGGLPVYGDSDNVAFFVEGDFDINNIDTQDDIGNEDYPEQTQIYLRDGYVFDDEENNVDGNIYAIIYAPDSDAHIQAGGNFHFEGAMILNDLNTQGGIDDENVQMAENVEEMEFSYEGAGPDFYYLHVTERTVTASS